ncbi:unnamed protein product [Gordionus sp. m RMFG-2023]
MSKHIELRANKSLIDDDFEKYQLTLDKTPTNCLPLVNGVNQIIISEKQYSYQHFLAFAHHNYLFSDIWVSGSVYWINKNNQIEGIQYDQNNLKDAKSHVYFDIPKNNYNESSKLGGTLSFPSLSYILCSDGHGIMYMLYTGDRTYKKSWKLIQTYKTFSHGDDILIKGRKRKIITDYQPSILLDSLYRHEIVTDYKQLSAGHLADHNFLECISFCVEERFLHAPDDALETSNDINPSTKKMQYDNSEKGGPLPTIKFVKQTQSNDRFDDNIINTETEIIRTDEVPEEEDSLDAQNNVKDPELNQHGFEEEITRTQDNVAKNIRNSQTHFVTLIEWDTFIETSEHVFELFRQRILESPCHVNHAAIERNGLALHILSDMPFKFIFDSAKRGPSENTKKPVYYWSQTSEGDLVIKLIVPESVTESEIDVTINSDSIKLCLMDESSNKTILLEGEFVNIKVAPEKSTWVLVNDKREASEVAITKTSDESKVKNNYLVITMPADLSDQIHSWPNPPIRSSLFEAQMDPEYSKQVLEDIDCRQLEQNCGSILESNSAPAIQILTEENNVPLSQPYNAQELEECDSYPSDTSLIARYDGSSHAITHQASLSSNKFLFTLQSQIAGQCPAFALRHDVHATFWDIHSMSVKHPQDYVPYINTSSFEALGYVIASKESRKFATAWVGLPCTYAAIADSTNHIFLYYKQTNQIEQSKRTESQMSASNTLKNRKTGKTFDLDQPHNKIGGHKLGVQKLITLEASGGDLGAAILGMVCLGNLLVVLGKDRISCVAI